MARRHAASFTKSLGSACPRAAAVALLALATRWALLSWPRPSFARLRVRSRLSSLHVCSAARQCRVSGRHLDVLRVWAPGKAHVDLCQDPTKDATQSTNPAVPTLPSRTSSVDEVSPFTAARTACGCRSTLLHTSHPSIAACCRYRRPSHRCSTKAVRSRCAGKARPQTCPNRTSPRARRPLQQLAARSQHSQSLIDCDRASPPWRLPSGRRDVFVFIADMAAARRGKECPL